jgi:hypothetical protein
VGEDAELAAAAERAWPQAAQIDDAYERGLIDTAGWHAAWLAIVEPAYLARNNPRAQSGQSGDPAGWERARRLLADALPGDCTLLDVGCASGHLMETLVDWAAQDGIAVEPYGWTSPPAWPTWPAAAAHSGLTASPPPTPPIGARRAGSTSSAPAWSTSRPARQPATCNTCSTTPSPSAAG